MRGRGWGFSLAFGLLEAKASNESPPEKALMRNVWGLGVWGFGDLGIWGLGGLGAWGFGGLGFGVGA